MKLSHKIYVLLACTVLLLWPVWEFGKVFFDWEYNNPVAYMQIRNEVTAHLKECHTDCFVAKMDYVSHRDGYVAMISHKTDKDFSFQIEFFATDPGMNCEHFDCRPQSEQLARTISQDYRARCASALAEIGFSFEEAEGFLNYYEFPYDELNEDIFQELAAQDAYLLLSLVTQDFSPENCTEILLSVRQAMDNANLPFASCSLFLYESKEQIPLPRGWTVDLRDISYSDITPQDLEKHITEQYPFND